MRAWLRRNLREAAAARNADLVVVVTTACVTAILGVLLADWLPTWLVASIGGAALLGLVGALLWRGYVHGNTGTLFSVQVLDEQMRDRRVDSRAIAIKRHMTTRSVTRWVDLTSRASNDVIDVHDTCREVGTALEQLINNDRDDTGYTVAPNMLWPMALAVGAYVPDAGAMRLLELHPRKAEESYEFILTDTATDDVVAEQSDSTDRSGRVGVHLAFTKAAGKFELRWFRDFGVSEWYQLTLGGTIPGDDVDYGGEQLRAISQSIADRLVEIKNSIGERELVVVAMVTKIVALAIGWHLAQRECRFFHGTHLMHYDQPKDQAKGTYIPMRVVTSQPTQAPS